MKLIQFIGARSKSDFVIYIAHLIGNMGYRALIIDVTEQQEYRYGYLRAVENEVLYDLQNVEIMPDVKTYSDITSALQAANEKVENFDYILVDSTNNYTFKDWPSFDKTYYVSDTDRQTVMKDVEILNEYVDRTGSKTLSRIHFDSPFFVSEDYIDFQINNRIDFIELCDIVEWNEDHVLYKQQMQYEYEIPYSRLNKNYKRAIQAIVTELCMVGNVDVEAAVKQSANKGLFNRFKRQTLEPNKRRVDANTKFQNLKEVK